MLDLSKDNIIYHRQWEERALKARAHNALHDAVERGDITRPSACAYKGCEEGGRIEAHHYLGYEKKHWLDVVFLCQKHHRQVHKVIRSLPNIFMSESVHIKIKKRVRTPISGMRLVPRPQQEV